MKFYSALGLSFLSLSAIVASSVLAAPGSAESNAALTPAPRGIGNVFEGDKILRNHMLAVSPGLGTITEDEWDNLWRVFPEALRAQAEKDSASRQRITLERYGFVMDPNGDPKRPIGFFEDKANLQASNRRGKWEMNCLLCHSGTIPSPQGPQFYMGAPNSTYDISTFVSDRISLYDRYRSFSSFTLKDKLMMETYRVASQHTSLNRSRGVYNVWPAGDFFLALRQDNMRGNLLQLFNLMVKGSPEVLGNAAADMDPPPWWNTKYRTRLWIDGFAPKEPRMNALQILPVGNPIAQMDQKFVDILEYIDNVPSPKYPFAINVEKANRGRAHFERACAGCHGSYSETDDSVAKYPNVTTHIGEVGTDRTRVEFGLSVAFRERVKYSWVGRDGAADVWTKPDGYMAPPLRGVWASAPYLHNGSVPTLKGILFSEQRPVIWKADRREYNSVDVGLNYTTPEMDREKIFQAAGIQDFSIKTNPYLVIKDADEQRKYFDTTSSMHGKSNQGHTFPEEEIPNLEDRMDLLEYLKTL